jgi:hypothetical protein
MNNTCDDDLDARLEEIRSRPHWTWDDYDRDDIASDAMSRGFAAAREERRLKRFEESLLEAVREINGNVIKLNPKN